MPRVGPIFAAADDCCELCNPDTPRAPPSATAPRAHRVWVFVQKSRARRRDRSRDRRRVRPRAADGRVVVRPRAATVAPRVVDVDWCHRSNAPRDPVRGGGRRRTPGGCSTVRDRRVRVRGRRWSFVALDPNAVRGDGGGDDDDEVDTPPDVRRVHFLRLRLLGLVPFPEIAAPPSRPGRGPAAMEKGRRARRWSPRRDRSSPRRRAIPPSFLGTSIGVCAFHVGISYGRESAASMVLRRFDPPTWYLCLVPSFSAPDTTSTLMSLSSNTSMGVCAFHAGSLNTVPVASPYADADQPHGSRYTDARAESRRSGAGRREPRVRRARGSRRRLLPVPASAEDALDSGAYG